MLEIAEPRAEGSDGGVAVEGAAVEYAAPFILPWVALAEDPNQHHPESFVPFTTGPEGAPYPHGLNPLPD
jgi:hypothetical protein